MQANLPLSDDAIIELYWQRDEDAIKQTDAKYKNYLLSVAYNMLRDSALKIIRALKIEGGCNVQFALDPLSFTYYLFLTIVNNTGDKDHDA